MTHRRLFFVFILLTIHVLACKNEAPKTEEPASTVPTSTAATTPTDPEREQQVASLVTQVPAPATAKPINYVSKEKILLKDNTTIEMPKAGDKAFISLYFATPGAKVEGSTALSQEGLLQSNRLTGTLAQAGLDIIWVDGNAGMQTALGSAKQNASEFNVFKAEAATETLKTIVHNYMGKKVLIVANPAIISDMMIQLAGKPVVTVPSHFSPVLYLVLARSLGDKFAQVTEMSY